MNKIKEIRNKLKLLNNKLQQHGKSECKEYKKGKCYFYAASGASYYIPHKCGLLKCPLIDKLNL